ncbi:hypothetical protein [Mycobacteroides abscessus]|uniref:hypothetical protein n=1 Tax=Mycobacteroides abscessus TaxID=36809 RepID=UPI001878E81C|nr:hypothetical protein [Mycobacteroides abscessus]
MANPPDPDFSSFDALPDGGGDGTLAQKAETAAAGVASAVTRFGEKNKGGTVNDAAAAAAEITNAGRVMGVNVALAEQAAKDLKAARDAWNKAAEGAKQKDLDAADKAVSDARADLAKAQTSEDEQRDKYNKAKGDQSAEGKMDVFALKQALDLAVGETTKAQEKLTKAIENAQKLHAQNKAACEALRATLQRIADSLKGVNSTTCPPGKSDVAGGSGVKHDPGSGTTSTPIAAGGATAGSSNPGKSTGTPGSTPGAAKPGTATPSAAAPETKTSGSTSDTAALASLLGQGQQNQQQPQTQQMPTMPQVPQSTQPQQQNKAGEKSELEKEAEKNGNDALTAAGLGGLVAPSVLGGGSTSPTPVTTPAGNGITTQLRGPEVKIPGAGASLGGAPAVNAQVPPTTGTSRTDLVTAQGNSEVGGRPVGTENKPFTATPAGAETRTSADHAGQGQGTGQQSRAATGTGGLPVGGMPVGGVGAPVAGGSPRGGKDGERVKIEMYPDEQTFLMNGGDTLSEATPGGTIAQNRPSRDDPRRNAA